jgi:alpha-mannosidase
MAEENVLRNEHFEVALNPTTGAIQAIDDYVSRGARLAQQLAFRAPRPRRSRQEASDEDALEKDYSIMAADEISVTSSGPMVGEIVCRGRLVDRDGERVARFVQTIEARRGSPILELRIDLDVEREPDADPWNSYYAARFAWGDAAADVYRGVCLANRPTERAQLESPHFLDICSGEKRITILTGGLPYHRRFGLRKLDTLLVVRGETARSFRLGIGVNLTHPVPAALGFLAPEHVHREKAPRPSAESGWLFHVDAKNVIATHWSPLRSDDRLTGFRVRLLETEGRSCRANLRSFRPVKSARKTDFRGEGPTELSAQDDRISIELKAHEWAQVEADFREK